VKAGRFGELDHSDLVHLLESLDDERSKARFRESIYISFLFWMAVVAIVIFAPRVFPRTPEFIVPTGELKDQKLTSLTVPAEVQKAINNVPKVKPSPRPSPAGGPSAPQAPAPPTPAQQAPPEQPQAQPRQSPQAAAPPPVVQQSPLQQPQPAQSAPLPSAPAPSAAPTKPNFGNPNTSARDMVQQATRAPHGGGGVTIGGGSGGAEHRGLGTGVDILSDTEGVDFNPYLQKIMREIYETWLPLIPEEARPPLNKQGETQIRFIILPDGRIGGMALEGSTHDDAINKSCWGSITGVGQFPALPSQFHGPKLELRVHYLVNKEPR
jgi:outer membrane biosynthesis protein TonB